MQGPYRIHAAAALCGVPATTMRAWERRYGVPVPRRTAAAYRLYDADDVALLTRMRELVDQGVSPAEAARVASASRDPSESPPSATDGIGDGLELACDRILAATHRWDPTAIDAELTRLSMLIDAQTMFERIISPVLHEVGQRWERGTMSVAQEHMLSERFEIAVRASLRAMDRADGPLALIACVDFEHHVLGALGAALRFAANGARTIVLGAMPPVALGEAVRSMAPRVVGLSTSVTPPGSKALFKAYGKACGKTPWVVGGPAAESLRPIVEAAGGRVASGPSSQWSQQIREWLRGAR